MQLNSDRVIKNQTTNTMNKYVEIIEKLQSQINKLENDFKRGIPPYQGFTIDVSYGGNTNIDLGRITIGSVSDDEDSSKILYELMLKSLKNSLEFFRKSAERELIEITKCLSNLNN